MEDARPKRFHFSVKDIKRLEKAYQKNSRITGMEAETLAESMGYKKPRIMHWFQNRRKKAGITCPAQRFTEEQRAQLEIAYQKKDMPSRHDFNEIAKMLDIEDVKRIRSWFSHRRFTDYHPNKPIFSQEQKKILVSIYTERRFPSRQDFDEIAEKFGTTTNQICSWFSERRAKDSLKDSILPGERCIGKVPQKIAHLTTTTKELLEAAFAENSQPTNQELKEIQEKTNIDKDILEIWFDRKRRITKSLVFTERSRCEKHHLNALIEAYQNNKKLTVKELNNLGDRIGMDRKCVYRWFWYHRSRDKEFNKDHYPKQILLGAEKRAILNEAYQQNRYLPPKDMYELADRAGMKQKQVQFWFNKKRFVDKSSKMKSHFTEDQNRSLEAAYQINPRPSRKEAEKIGMNAGLSFIQVKNWYFKARDRYGCTKMIVPLTTKQRDVLLEDYKKDQYPRAKKLAELAIKTGLSETKIRHWFERTRFKEKKLRTANLLLAKQEESDSKHFMKEIKLEPMDIGLDHVQRKIKPKPMDTGLGHVQRKFRFIHFKMKQ